MLTCMLSERKRRPISSGEGLQAAVREAETSIIVATSTMPRADMYPCHPHSLIRLTQTITKTPRYVKVETRSKTILQPDSPFPVVTRG